MTRIARPSPEMQTAVRESWRPYVAQSRTRRIARFVWRLWALTLPILLIGVLGYLLFAPFRHPNVCGVFLTGGEYSPAAGKPVPFHLEEYARLQPLQRVLSRVASQSESFPFAVLESPSATTSLLEGFAELESTEQDVLLVFISGHGICLADEPQLVCRNFELRQPQQGLVPIRQLLDQLRRAPIRLKVIVLDAGSSDSDPQFGLAGGDFHALLAEEVRRTGDAGLWVFHSHASFERSHVSPALRSSVFGYWVGQGLLGAADLDRSRSIDLAELSQYVRLHVADWVGKATEGLMSQTPTLLWGGGDAQAGGAPILVPVTTLKPSQPVALTDAVRQAHSVEWQNEIATLQKPPSRMAGLLPSLELAQADSSQGRSDTADSGDAQTPPAPVASADTEVAPAADTNDGQVAPDTKSTAATDGAKSDTTPTKTAAAEESAAGANGSETAPATPTPGGTPGNAGDALQERLTFEKLLAEAWSLRDRLEEPVARGIHVIDDAPHIWAQAVERLLWYEQVLRTGSVAELSVQQPSLRRMLVVLRALAQGERPPPQRNPDPLATILEYRAPVLLPPDGYSTLALAEHQAEAEQRTLDRNLAGAARALDEYIRSGNADTVKKWLAADWKPEYARYYELRLLQRLLSDTSIPPALARVALDVRRLGERVATHHRWSSGWLADRIRHADQERLAGERVLFDQIGSDWQAQAQKQLEQARADYLDAKSTHERLQEFLVLRNRVIFRARDYLRWRYVAHADTRSRTPRADDLRELFDLLQESDVLFRETLESATVGKLARWQRDLVRLNTRLETALADIETRLTSNPLDPGNNAWRFEALLNTRLPTGAHRVPWTQAWATADAEWIERFVPPDPVHDLEPSQVLTDDDVQFRQQQEELELQFLHSVAGRLLQGDGTTSKELEPGSSAGTIASLKQDPAAAARSERLIRAHEMLQRRISDVAAQTSLSDPDSRVRRLEELRSAQEALRVVDARSASELPGLELNRQIHAADLYDTIKRHHDRWLAALEDCPTWDKTYLEGNSLTYRSLAGQIPDQPPMLSVPPALWQLTGPSGLSLVSVSEGRCDLQLDYRGESAMPMWLLLHYDTELLEVTPRADYVVYEQATLAAELRQLAQAAEQQRQWQQLDSSDVGGEPSTRSLAPHSVLPADKDPLRPDQHGFAESIVLRAGTSRTLPLVVRRKSPALRPAKLIVKAIGGGSYLRHEVEVTLPGRSAIGIVAADDPIQWTGTPEGLLLHPAPNRSTAFHLRLVNQDDRERNVDVQLFAPSAPVTVTLPAGAQPLATIESTLEQLGRRVDLLSRSGMKIPPGGFVPLASPPPKEPLAETEQPADGTAQPAAGTANTPRAEPIPHGLILAVTDRAAGEAMLKRITFAPQHPRRYVHSQVGYDIVQQRIEVTLTAVNNSVVPAAGIPVRAYLGDTSATQPKFDGVLAGPAYTARLFVPLPANADEVTLYVDIDHYPRAFVYKIRSGIPVPNVPEWSDRLAVRMIAPLPGQTFRTPLAGIPAIFQVDAPLGTFPFEAGQDYVEAGIDADRDREFGRDLTVKFFSERQVEIASTGVTPQGALNIHAKVGDFSTELPAAHAQNVRANVLARLATPGHSVWSEPAEVVLDGSPPQIERVELRPDRAFPVGAELEVSVWTADGELSGVAKVEVAIDTKNIGEFPTEPAPIAAELRPPTRWVAVLKTEELAPGSYHLLVRATDRVGNQTDLQKIAIQVGVPTATGTTANANRVSGSVTYGNLPLANAKVELEVATGAAPPAASTAKSETPAPAIAPVTTDSRGQFQFPNVPAGTYKLRARGLTRNKPRKAEVEVKVEPPPAKGPHVELQAR